jgi:hypothetical protein
MAFVALAARLCHEISGDREQTQFWFFCAERKPAMEKIPIAVAVLVKISLAINS